MRAEVPVRSWRTAFFLLLAACLTEVSAAARPGLPAAESMLELYVSPTGDDERSGRRAEPDGKEGPFATLARARDEVRRRKAEGRLPARVVVRLRGGRHRLSGPVVFTPEDSGPVTYAAFPGESPVLDGGAVVAGWRAEERGGIEVWSADVSGLVGASGPLRSVFVNGERRARPRLPREGFYRAEAVPGVELGSDPWAAGVFEGSDAFRAAPGHLGSWRNLTDVEILLFHFWIEERLALVSWDEATRIARTGAKSQMILLDESGKTHPRYVVENVVEALSAGEWYLDRPSGRLLYAPRPGETKESVEVVAPRTRELLRLEGDPDRGLFVEGLRFEGLGFAHADWEPVPSIQAAFKVPGAVRLRGARDVAFVDDRFEHMGGYALEIGDGCTGIRVVGSTMQDLGAGGLKIGGSPAEPEPGEPSPATEPEEPSAERAQSGRRRRTGHVSVTDNEISSFGRVFPSAVGILVQHAFATTLAHNHIHDGFYTGISVGWVWGYGPNVARDNRIEKNHVHDIGQELLSDMGGVYTLGSQPGTVIRGNLVHDVRSAGYGGWGIYPDEGSSHVVIEDNVVYRTSSQAFHQHYGNENIVRNNIFAFGGQGVIALSRSPSHAGGRGRYSATFERNVIVSDARPIYLAGKKADEQARAESHPFVSDLNVIWDVSGAAPVSGNGRPAVADPSPADALGPDAWRALGYDRHSAFADPRFRDPARPERGLADGSPAFDVGFQPIDVTDVGPRPRGRRVE
jgi:hypothetical protein